MNSHGQKIWEFFQNYFVDKIKDKIKFNIKLTAPGKPLLLQYIFLLLFNFDENNI